MKRLASLAFPRSTAMVYWVRSLVPTLKNALTSARRSAIRTAAGVSIMTPTGTESALCVPAFLSALASSATSCILHISSTEIGKLPGGPIIR